MYLKYFNDIKILIRNTYYVMVGSVLVDTRVGVWPYPKPLGPNSLA